MLRVLKLVWWHRQFLLAGDAERCSAGSDNLESGARAEQLTDDRSCRKDLLEVVEHEQHPLALAVIEKTLERQLRATHLHAERVRNRRRNEVGVTDRCERVEGRTVAEFGRRF